MRRTLYERASAVPWSWAVFPGPERVVEATPGVGVAAAAVELRGGDRVVIGVAEAWVEHRLRDYGEPRRTSLGPVLRQKLPEKLMLWFTTPLVVPGGVVITVRDLTIHRVGGKDTVLQAVDSGSLASLEYTGRHSRRPAEEHRQPHTHWEGDRTARTDSTGRPYDGRNWREKPASEWNLGDHLAADQEERFGPATHSYRKVWDPKRRVWVPKPLED